ncbi:MAG: hypothetical protein DME19_17835 [Verrucomicrobia bacterium]|nr:MAG: hypothetical protein DME19_17835 [Verrucomicrobiota bacterium]
MPDLGERFPLFGEPNVFRLPVLSRGGLDEAEAQRRLQTQRTGRFSRYDPRKSQPLANNGKPNERVEVSFLSNECV